MPISVCRLSLNEATSELSPETNPFVISVPKLQKAEDLEPWLELVSGDGVRSKLSCMRIVPIAECVDCLAFYTESILSNQRQFFWISDKAIAKSDMDQIQYSFESYKRQYLGVNMTTTNLMKNLKLFIAGDSSSSLAHNPYFMDTFNVVEACLQRDPSLVDYDYAVFLQNNPHRMGSLYDYLLYLSER
jgi:hypothetical protein